MGANPTNTDARRSLKMSPAELAKYQLEKYGQTVEHVVAPNPSLSIHEAVSPFASPEEGPLPFSAYNHERIQAPELRENDPGTSHGSRPTKITYRLIGETWTQGDRHPEEDGGSIPNSFRPTDHFDRDDLGDKTWKEVAPVPSLLTNTCDPIAEIIKNHSRSDGIAKKIASYQQRLDAPATPLTEEERAKFTNLITAFTAARTYQESMINHLVTSESSPDPRIARLQQVEKLSAASQLNARPNKIELLAEKLEQDYENLSHYQESAQQRQSEIDAEPAPIDIPDPRLTSIEHLNHAITHQHDLINERVTTALLMRPPYEAPNEATQATLSTHKWHSIEYEAEAQRHESLAKVALDNDDASYLRRAAESFEQVALEAQKPNPKQQSIDCFTQSASLYKEAAEADTAGLNKKGRYLDTAGLTFSDAAREAQKPTPNQQIIDWFTQSASLFKEAAEAYAAGQNGKVSYLDKAANAFSYAALEAQKPNPKQQSIDLFTQSASLYKEAAADTAGQNGKASYLHQAANAFFEAAEEAQKPNPDHQKINFLTQSVSSSKEFAKTKGSNE
jgi:hypothetical protein